MISGIRDISSAAAILADRKSSKTLIETYIMLKLEVNFCSTGLMDRNWYTWIDR